METWNQNTQEQKILQYFKNINELIIEENNIIEKIKRLCEQIDIFYTTYSTFTYLFEGEIPITLSAQHVHRLSEECNVLSEDEKEFYKRIMNQNITLQLKNLEAFELQKPFYKEACEKGYDACYYLPIYSTQQQVLGFFLIYYQSENREQLYISGFQQRIEKILQIIHNLEMYQLQIEQLTYVDAQTNLPSYTQFLQRMDKRKLQNESGIIQIIEPSEFSKIVELYGRPAGETILKELGARIKQLPISEDSELARFTSSSLIFFKPLSHVQMKNTHCTSIVEVVNEPFYINGNKTYITLKIGLAPFNHSSAYQDVIRFAESALTKAKLVPGTNEKHYRAQESQSLERELTLLNHLKAAMLKKEIQAHFQPKFELYRGRIASMEALARWISPELGFVSPAEFIPIAESSGLIRELELQIFEQVLQWMQQRQFEGKRIVPIAVNISPEHFYHPLFLEDLTLLIEKYYADPSFIIIEITENMGLHEFDYAKKILTKLRTMGISTSVDDFGTGHSSLSYLQRFPFCELKIDQSFSQKIEELATETIVKSIIRIAHMLDMVVVAEGVETLEQAKILKELRCDIVQGYYFSKPLPIAEATELYDRLQRQKK